MGRGGEIFRFCRGAPRLYPLAARERVRPRRGWGRRRRAAAWEATPETRARCSPRLFTHSPPQRKRRRADAAAAALAAQRGDELSGAGPEAEEGRLAPSGRREEGVRCGEGRVPAEVHLDRRREPTQIKRLATGGLALEALHLARARRPHEGSLGQVLVRGDRAHPGGVGRRVEQADGGGVAGKGDPRKRVDVQQRRTALVRHH